LCVGSHDFKDSRQVELEDEDMMIVYSGGGGFASIPASAAVDSILQGSMMTMWDAPPIPAGATGSRATNIATMARHKQASL
jgi:hypothetical protein